MNLNIKIDAIVAKRHELLNSEDPPRDDVDALTAGIYDLLKAHQDELTVEFILETLTQLGAAPSLLYDDNAHWTVGADGSQNIICDEDRTETTVFNASWIVEPNRWRKTIREAIKDYLK